MRTHARTAQDTEDFGGRLARSRPAADAALAVLYLTGELGAGKTTFARGFVRALGVQEVVPSPTYTLLELYPAGALTELESLALREWARTGHVWLIEWPERGGTRLPPADLTVALTAGEAGHDIEVGAHSALGGAWLAPVLGARGGGRVEV